MNKVELAEFLSKYNGTQWLYCCEYRFSIAWMFRTRKEIQKGLTCCNHTLIEIGDMTSIDNKIVDKGYRFLNILEKALRHRIFADLKDAPLEYKRLKFEELMAKHAY